MAEETGGLTFHPMDQFVVKPLFGGELERLLEVRSTLVRRLGQDRFDSLTAVGAGLDDSQVVDQARGALREVGSG